METADYVISRLNRPPLNLIMQSVERSSPFGLPICWVTEDKSGQLCQCLSVNATLELNHGLKGHPVVAPAPSVKLWMITRTQGDIGIPPGQTQDKPDLLLAAIRVAPFTPNPLLRHFITQPITRAPENPDMFLPQADFLVQFTVHRMFG